MKRSRTLKLTLMSAAPLALSACSSRGPENLVYETLSECYSDTRVSHIECDNAYNRALSEHTRSAARFMTLEACQERFGLGRCDQLTDAGTAYFSPRMSGFMVGRYMPPATNWYGHSYGHSMIIVTGDWNPRPLYRTSSDWNTGGWSTGDGHGWSGSKSATKSSISTSSLGRGGFGGSSSARGGWGG